MIEDFAVCYGLCLVIFTLAWILAGGPDNINRPRRPGC